MDKSTLIGLLEQEIKGLSSYLEANDYVNALDDAARETGWSLPTTNDFQILWFKNRAKRHLFFYLQTEQAYKFKFEQINLQQRFEHLDTLIKRMDNEFAKAIKENIAEFGEIDAYKIFGTYLHTGFASDEVGRDTTFLSDNEVDFHPNDTD